MVLELIGLWYVGAVLTFVAIEVLVKQLGRKEPYQNPIDPAFQLAAAILWPLTWLAAAVVFGGTVLVWLLHSLFPTLK